MTAILLALLTVVMPGPVQPFGYAVKVSSYPYATTNLSADAQPGDVVMWQLPSEVLSAVSPDGHFATLWVAGTDRDGSPVHYWSGRYTASYTVYRVGRVPRRVEFFLIVR